MGKEQIEMIGGYSIGRKLGEGAMGAVYLGYHDHLPFAAIKVLFAHLANDPHIKDRFVREATAIADIIHPHIVHTMDFGVQDEQHYIVMEYLGGGTLQAAIEERGTLSILDACRIGAQVADALDHAHRANLVHRDLKPANIMFRNQTYTSAVLTDFGLVRVLGDGLTTTDGKTLGTPAYISPEVVKGHKAEASADLYALGIILYEMLTGKPPYSANNMLALLMKHVQAPLPDMHGNNWPLQLVTLITQLLAKEPVQRPSSAAAVRNLLNEIVLNELPTDPHADNADQTTLVIQDALPTGNTPPPHLINRLPLLFDESRQFHNRTEHIAKLRGFLNQQERIVVVFGKSGIGKTALVCKVLGDLIVETNTISGLVVLSAGGDDSVRQINLDRIISDFQKLLPNTDFAITPQMPPTQQANQLLDALGAHSGTYILLLDNFESLQGQDHVPLDTGLAALLEAVIERGRLSVLITSRIPLRLGGTGHTARLQLVALDNGLPADDALVFMRNLPMGGNLPHDDDLRQLISQTDGHPRALEAAADWLNENPLSGMGDLLADIEAQQGDVVHWLVGKSIDGLAPDMQRIMQGIALFNSPAPVAALEYMIAPFVAAPRAVRNMLNLLVLRRFVRFDAVARTLDLHGIDRAYCRAQIPATSANESTFGRYALLRRAATYFADHRLPPDRWLSRQDLVPQLSEIEFRFLLAEYDTAADLLLSIDRAYMWRWGHIRELLHLYDQLHPHLTDLSRRQQIIANFAGANWMVGHLRESVPLFDESLRLATATDDAIATIRALGNLGIVHRNMGDLLAALDYFEQAATLATDHDQPALIAMSIHNMGLVQYDLGNIQAAIACQQQLLDNDTTKANHAIYVAVLGSLALAYAAIGQFEASIHRFEATIVQCRDLSDTRSLGTWLAQSGFVKYLAGNTAAAIATLESAVQLCHETENLWSELVARTDLARIRAADGDIATAIDLAQKAHTMAYLIGDPRFQGYSSLRLGQIYLLAGQPMAALAFGLAAQQHDSIEFNHLISNVLGMAALLGEDIRAAKDAFAKTLVHTSALLDKTPSYCSALYARGLAFAGLALLATETSEQQATLRAAEAAYEQARATSRAGGILNDARRWLGLLQDAPHGDLLRPLYAHLS